MPQQGPESECVHGRGNVERKEQEQRCETDQEFFTIQDVAVIPTMVTAWLGAVL
jgi:hypothetical protein